MKKNCIRRIALFIWMIGSVVGMLTPCFAQSDADAVRLYRDLASIRLFEQKPANVESILKYTSVRRPEPVGRFGVEVYEFGWGRLTIAYSAGRCSETNSKLGYDLAKGIVTRVDLFFFEARPIDGFDFDLTKFRRYKDEEGDSVTLTDEANGLVLTGNDTLVRSIEREPSEVAFRKHHCSVQK